MALSGLRGLTGKFKGTVDLKLEIEVLKVHWWSRKVTLRICESIVELGEGSQCLYNLNVEVLSD